MQEMFNRSFSFLFSYKKVAFTSLSIFLSFLLFLFLQKISFLGGVFSYFCSLFLMIPLGIILCQNYAKELKGNTFSWKGQILSLGEYLLTKSLWALFFVISAAVLAVGVLVFRFFQSLSFLQETLSSFLFFVPFLLVFLFAFLVFLSLFLLFWMVPEWAFQKKGTKKPIQEWFISFKKNPYLYCSFLIKGSLPFLLTLFLLEKALFFTHSFVYTELSFLGRCIQDIVISLLFSFFLSFSVIFFFHMATEAFYFRKISKSS